GSSMLAAGSRVGGMGPIGGGAAYCAVRARQAGVSGAGRAGTTAVSSGRAIGDGTGGEGTRTIGSVTRSGARSSAVQIIGGGAAATRTGPAGVPTLARSWA